MGHGVSFEHFEMELNFEDFIIQTYPKTAPDLLQLLPPLQTLEFLYHYHQFTKELFQKIASKLMYSLLLLLMGIALSYFFLYRFEPGIRSLLSDFGSDVTQLKTYVFFIKMILSLFNTIVILLIITLLLIQSHDNRVLLNVFLTQHSKAYKRLISYQYSMMMNLFLQFDMKTSNMVSFLRTSSVGVINKWLSYHVESQLDQGLALHVAMDLEFFDDTMIDFMKMGYHHADLKLYLQRYCQLMEVEIQRDINKFSLALKTAVFCFLIVIVAIFYSVLYLPLQVLEVL